MDQDGAGRRVRGIGTWAAAREAYLAGLSAGEVCARFDLGLSALRARARREGWRRGDQPDSPPPEALDPDLAEDLDEELEAAGDPDLEAMADRAGRLAARALALGRLAEAEGWTRLWRRLGGLNAAPDQAREADRRPRADEAPAAADVHSLHSVQPERPPAPRPADVHSVHSVHSKKAPPPAPAEPPGPRNRAERLRAAALARKKRSAGSG